MRLSKGFFGLLAFSAVSSALAQSPVASYNFAGNFLSGVAGAPNLGTIGGGSFGTANVFSSTTSVYNTNGAQGDGNNAGLTLNASSLLTSGSVYTMQMVISKSAPGTDSWLKVLDVSDRVDDAGFYYDPSDTLEIYPTSSGGPNVAYNNFYNIVLTVNGTAETVYLNGAPIFNDNSGVMDLNVADKTFNFFVDDFATGNEEFSDTSVSYIALYNSALTAQQVASLPLKGSAAPEPCSMLALAGAIGIGLRRRAKRS